MDNLGTWSIRAHVKKNYFILGVCFGFFFAVFFWGEVFGGFWKLYNMR